MAFIYTYAPTVPVGSDNASVLNVTLTNFKNAIKERLALEHQDLVLSSSDNNSDTAQGRHIPGKVSLTLCATEATILATTGSPKYSLAYSTDTKNLFIFNGTVWDIYTLITTSPHKTGMLMMWLGATAPTGWLLCDGSTFSAVTYPALNTLLGGNTLPNFSRTVPVGYLSGALGTTTGVGATVGYELIHRHSLSVIGYAQTGATTAFQDSYTDYTTITMPIYTVNFIIKT